MHPADAADTDWLVAGPTCCAFRRFRRCVKHSQPKHPPPTAHSLRHPNVNAEDIKGTVKRELPNWLREDPAFRTYVMELTRGEYADRRETSNRFYDILGELRRDRERQDQKCAENNREWDENQAALARMRERRCPQVGWNPGRTETPARAAHGAGTKI